MDVWVNREAYKEPGSMETQQQNGSWIVQGQIDNRWTGREIERWKRLPDERGRLL
jgi:hypothetical protein